MAGKLHVGEPVREADGRAATVVAVHVVPGAASMWDLTVSNVHDFAVGDGAFVVRYYDDTQHQDHNDLPPHLAHFLEEAHVRSPAAPPC